MYKIEIRNLETDKLVKKKFYESIGSYEKYFIKHQGIYSKRGCYIIGFRLTSIEPLEWTRINGGRT